MEEWSNWLMSETGLIFAIALVVFIVTIILIIKRFVSFIVTVILLVLCVGSAYFLINPKKFMSYFSPNSELSIDTEGVGKSLKKGVDNLLQNYNDDSDASDQ